MRVNAVLFRDMLPLVLFPGRKRVGKDLLALSYDPSVQVHTILDWYNPFSWAQGYAIAKRSEIVVLPWWTSSVSHMYLVIQLLLRSRSVVIIEFHEVLDPLEQSLFVISLYAKVMGKVIRSLADGYVVHTIYDRDLISTHYHIPPERISVIPHGLYDHYPVLDKSAARSRLRCSERFVILFFGLLRPFKGVPYLIRAFETLPPEILENSYLFIVGEAWEDQVTVGRASSSPVAHRITVVDRYASDEEVALFYSSADVFVAPYTKGWHDPCAVCHIAMAYGMPVIASGSGGMRESMESYEGTVFVEPESPEAIRDALIGVYHGKRQSYSPPPHLKWDSIAGQWEEMCRAWRRERGRQ
jgi:glycosyltransferase involved in cell wall biosynthesis